MPDINNTSDNSNATKNFGKIYLKRTNLIPACSHVMIEKTIFTDRSLSFEVIGLYGYLLSLDTHFISIDFLSKEFNMPIEKVLKSLSILNENGYFSFTEVQI